jgi:hypothetical protein
MAGLPWHSSPAMDQSLVLLLSGERQARSPSLLRTPVRRFYFPAPMEPPRSDMPPQPRCRGRWRSTSTSLRPARLRDRTWPDKKLTKAPRWCSVDLRDGNQALIDLMDPSASAGCSRPCEDGLQGDRGRLSFGVAARLRLRPLLIEEDLVPDDVTSRCSCSAGPADPPDLQCLQAPGGPSCTSTTPVHPPAAGRFGLDKPGIVDIAVNAAKLCRKLEETMGDTEIFYEYSPESYTGPRWSSPSRSARRSWT